MAHRWNAGVIVAFVCSVITYSPSAVYGDDRDDIRRWIESPFDLNGDGVIDAVDFFLLAARFGPAATPTPPPVPTATPTPTPDATELALPPVGQIQSLEVEDVTTTFVLDFPKGDEAYLVVVRNEDDSGSSTEVAIEWSGNSFAFGKPDAQVRVPEGEIVLEREPAPEIGEKIWPPEIRTVSSVGKSPESIERIALEVGEQRSFDLYGGSVVEATLRYLGTNAAVYVDDDNWMQGEAAVDQDFVDEHGQFFDTTTYPELTSVFGEPGDVNRDDHVAILFTEHATEGGAGGVAFFFGGDLFQRNRLDPRFPTNSMEILYVAPPNTPDTTFRPDQVAAIIGHELQHLINFYYHSLVHGGGDGTHDEERWLDEGLAHLAQDYVGSELYSNRGFVERYLESSDFVGILVDSFVPNVNQRGGAYLLCRYIADRFGDEVLNKLADTGKQGITNIEAATGIPFEELTRDWSRAVFLSDLSINDDPILNYTHFASLGHLPGRWWSKPHFADHNFPDIFFFGSLYYGTIPRAGFSYTVFRNSAAGAEELHVLHLSGPRPAVDVIRLPNNFLYPGFIDVEAWQGLILDQAYPDIWPAGEERVFSGRSADGEPFTSLQYFVCRSPCNTIFSSWIQDATIDGDRFEFTIRFDEDDVGPWDIGVFPNGSNLRNRVEVTVVAP